MKRKSSTAAPPQVPDGRINAASNNRLTAPSGPTASAKSSSVAAVHSHPRRWPAAPVLTVHGRRAQTRALPRPRPRTVCGTRKRYSQGTTPPHPPVPKSHATMQCSNLVGQESINIRAHSDQLEQGTLIGNGNINGVGSSDEKKTSGTHRRKRAGGTFPWLAAWCSGVAYCCENTRLPSGYATSRPSHWLPSQAGSARSRCCQSKQRAWQASTSAGRSARPGRPRPPETTEVRTRWFQPLAMASQRSFGARASVAHSFLRSVSSTVSICARLTALAQTGRYTASNTVRNRREIA